MAERMTGAEIWARRPWEPRERFRRLKAIRLPLVLAAANYFAWPLVDRVIPAAWQQSVSTWCVSP